MLTFIALEVMAGPLSSINCFCGKRVNTLGSCYFKVDTETDGFSYSLHVTVARTLAGFLTIDLRESVLTKAVLRDAVVFKP